MSGLSFGEEKGRWSLIDVLGYPLVLVAFRPCVVRARRIDCMPYIELDRAGMHIWLVGRGGLDVLTLLLY
jgi:hypothetical protein